MKAARKNVMERFDEMREALLDELESNALQYQRTATLENGMDTLNHSPLAPVLTLDDLAKHLKISKATAYDLVKQDGFPAFRIGKSIRINAYMLEEWIQKQCAEQKEAA